MIYRVYFNRRADAPLVWSIDDGNQAAERLVRGFRLEAGVIASGVYTGGKANEASPVAWLQVEGSLEIRHDFAVFRQELAVEPVRR